MKAKAMVQSGFVQASTGPRSIERGMRLAVGSAAHLVLASTGPRSIERGMSSPSPPGAATHRGFNGAALN